MPFLAAGRHVERRDQLRIAAPRGLGLLPGWDVGLDELQDQGLVGAQAAQVRVAGATGARADGVRPGVARLAGRSGQGATG